MFSIQKVIVQSLVGIQKVIVSIQKVIVQIFLMSCKCFQ